MTLNAAIKGLMEIGKNSKFAKNITVHLNRIPKVNAENCLNFGINLKAKATPKTVENSARAFIDAPRKSPLRANIAKSATAEVKMLEKKPKIRNDKTIGAPVKSNLRNGSQGNLIFKLEYLNE